MDTPPQDVLPQPDRDDIAITDVMRALADPVRMRALAKLTDGEEHGCQAVADGLGLHKSTMSHHYRTLREAGVTSTRVSGRDRLVRLRREDLDARFPGLLDAVLNAFAE